MTDIVLDDDLVETFTILRSNGQWLAGRFQETKQDITASGTITVADAVTLKQVPEGDRRYGAIAIKSDSEIYVTRSGNNKAGAGLSDIIVWRNQQWRVIKVKPWKNLGNIWMAIAVRLSS